MPALTYNDQYLAPLVTDDRENRARSDVDTHGSFTDEWRDKLTVLRAYVLVCLECSAAPDDLFSARLKSYRSEFSSALTQALSSGLATGETGAVFSIPIGRN